MTWDMGHPAGREPAVLIRDLGPSLGREPGPLLRAKRGLITKATVYPATGGFFLALHLKIATTKINTRESKCKILVVRFGEL